MIATGGEQYDGHILRAQRNSEISDKNAVKEKLRQLIEGLILNGADTFYLGGYGDFDRISAAVVKELQAKYPHIRAVLVLAYLRERGDLEQYDETIYPPLENVPPRYAIAHRNRWMADNADAVVAYVNRRFGGAAAALRYARRKNKILCDLAAQ